MLMSRLYSPEKSDIIYHYCSSSAFQSIIEGKKMRFSDLFSMNDFMEMHWGYGVFEQAATHLIPSIPKQFFDEIDEQIRLTGFSVLPLIACFSLNGDVLSQWRAYADDGLGYCIGFDACHMANMAVRPLKVLYNKDEQIGEMVAILRSLYDVECQDNHKRSDDFKSACRMLALDISSLKNPAFAEELEVRLAHGVTFDHHPQGIRLKSVGGQAWGKRIKPIPIEYRFKRETPVPFVSIGFCRGTYNPVKEIMLGPRNESLLSGVELYLNTIGVSGVKVSKSEASYKNF